MVRDPSVVPTEALPAESLGGLILYCLALLLVVCTAVLLLAVILGRESTEEPDQLDE